MSHDIYRERKRKMNDWPKGVRVKGDKERVETMKGGVNQVVFGEEVRMRV